MKRKGLLALLISLTSTTFIATVLSTVAWFSTYNSVSPEDNLIGFSDGAYFAYGDGLTPETAFGIKTPRQLYNLAWLQYLGYFNKDDKNNTTGAVGADHIIDHQYYFELDPSIESLNMTGWFIPPIGTQLYPFVGNFNGNNKQILNLTTTNNYADFNKVPTVIRNSGTITNVNIVGMFGVVGTLGNTDQSITSGSKTYTYSTSAISIRNFGLDNFTAKTVSTNSLIGLVAGYMNGPINGVAVKDSKISTNGNKKLVGISEELSENGLVGYAKPIYKATMLNKDVEAQTPTVTNDVQSGSGDEFGASIAMRNMYTRLLGLKTAATSFTYNTSETYINGVHDTSSDVKATYELSMGGSTYTIKGNSETDSSSRTVSKFSFYDRGTSYDDYMYLYGDKSLNYNQTRIDFTDLTTVPTNGMTVYIHEGTNYLRYNNSSLSNGTAAQATLWTYNNGKFYNGSNYLRNDSGTLTTTSYSSNATTWNVSINNAGGLLISNTISTTTYYLAYKNASWTQLKVIDSSVKYYFHSGNNYFRWGGVQSGNVYARVYNTTNINEATKWIQSGNNYYPEGYSNYTLGYCDPDWPLQAYSDTNSAYTYQTNGNNTYLGSSSKYSGYYYYAKYDSANDSWGYSRNATQSTARNNASIVTRTQVPIPTASDFGVYLSQRSSSTSQKTFTTNPTYFPLSYEENVDANGNGLGTYNTNVASKNTGYVISGSNYTSQPGDIRVSQYAMSNLSNANNGDSYVSDKTNVVTVNSSTGEYAIIQDEYNKSNKTINSNLTGTFGSSRTSVKNLGLEKYSSSRRQLHKLLNGSSNVYGLHFMNASISPSNKITVPYASINGENLSQYELPRDAIDFNLKNHGIINFFAGSYFPNNNTFFSLHNIIRDDNNNISNIKEISKIYKNTGANRKVYRYIYEYTDGSLNTDDGTYDSSEVLFDMSWVTNPTMVTNALYYYEIPANKGEYALGSVSGKLGAYLIYLDIGAGVKTKNITTYTEKITTVTDTYYFVKGIDFVAVIPANLATVTGGTVANITIPVSTNGNTTFSYNGTNKTLTCGPPQGITLTAPFISNEVTVKVGSDDLIAVSSGTSTTVLDKVTTITYDSEQENVVKNVFLTETVDGVAGEEQALDPEVLATDVLEYEAPAIIDGGEQTLVHFYYEILGTGTCTIETEYDSDTDTYNITVTTNVKIVIHVVDVLETYTGSSGTTNYTVTINETTIADGDVLTIQP